MSRRHRPRRNSGSPYQLYLLGAAIVIGLVGIVVVISATTSGSGTTVPTGPIVVPDARPAAVEQTGHVYGDMDAPVTIDEYLDYQCPFCMLAAMRILPVIEEQYIETGIAKLVIHPIAILGDESVQAAAAAEAANDQGKFLLYHDALLANQGGENVGAFSDERLREIAEAVGLNMEAFRASFDSGANTDIVRSSTQSAGAMGIRSTPTFLVDGVRIETGVEQISAAIELAAAQ